MKLLRRRERFTAKRTTNLSLATLRGSSCAVRRAISYWCRGLWTSLRCRNISYLSLEPEPEEE